MHFAIKVHKMQLNKRSKNRIRKLSDTLFRTIQVSGSMFKHSVQLESL